MFAVGFEQASRADGGGQDPHQLVWMVNKIGRVRGSKTKESDSPSTRWMVRESGRRGGRKMSLKACEKFAVIGRLDLRKARMRKGLQRRHNA
jgi:hypothetical protein